MRTVHLLAVLTVALGVCAAQVDAALAVAPTLRLVKLAPLTLRGSHFQAGERVRVTLTFRRIRMVRTLRADAAGRFTYRYVTLLALEPCRSTLVVTAFGTASGLRAAYKRRCRPPDPLP